MLWQLKKDMDVWDSLQSASSKLLGIPMLLVDGKGVSLSDGDHDRNVYPEKNASVPYTKNEFQDISKQITQTNEYLIYRYSYNLLSITFPIFVERHYVGHLFMGKIRIKKQKSSEQLNTAAGLQDEELSAPSVIDDCENANKISHFHLGDLVAFGKTFVAMIVNLLEARIKSGDYKFGSVENSRLEDRAETSLIDKAITILQERDDRLYKLSELAKELNCSSSTLKKHFSKYLHEDFSTYYSDLKIISAKNLLLHTNETTKSISEKLGYSSSTALYKSFKRKTGMTMTEFRSTNRES